MGILLFYREDDYAKYDSYTYATAVKTATDRGGMWYDEQMVGIKYISTSTKEERDFRFHLLFETSSEELELEKEKLKKIRKEHD